MSFFDMFATAAASRDVFDVGSRQLQGFFEDDIDFSFATKAVVCEGTEWYTELILTAPLAICFTDVAGKNGQKHH